MNPSLTISEMILLGAYYTLLVVLSVYGVHRYSLVRLRRKFSDRRLETPPMNGEWPSLTVQLPVFNEPNVVSRLIDAAASLEYQGRLHIQVLDDSTDETTAIAARIVAAHRSRGLSIEHVCRDSRTGFKAGALAAGLELDESELVAVFDADFVPRADLLHRMVPWFSNENIGMVQARWGHLNREESLLTRAQAVYLDGHFAVESAARFFSGRFFNFNGTAGIWRRQAIDEAGGWSSATLTEDLDLSYRAQLEGWKFMFLPDVEVSAELPESLAGFHSQQKRWAKGSIQTARRMLGRLFASDLPGHVKLEAFFHLTNNSAYLLTLLLALLLVPAMAIRHLSGLDWTLAVDAFLFFLSTGSVVAFYREGQRQLGRRLTRKELFSVLPVGIGLSVVNSAAVLEGLVHSGGYFSRTPKSGARVVPVGLDKFRRIPLAEVLLSVFFIGSVAVFAANGHYLALPFLLLFGCGYSHVAAFRLLESTRG